MIRSIAATFFLLAPIACVHVPPPTAQYFGPTAGEPRAVGDLEVSQGPPKRPYEDLGTVQVACPAVAATSGNQYGSQSQMHGGCSYAHALLLAQEQVAAAGADGLYSVQTSAASNGNIVSLTAAVFRFSSAPAEPIGEAQQADPSKPTVEARLKKLKELHEQQLITDQDYESRKAEILKEL